MTCKQKLLKTILTLASIDDRSLFTVINAFEILTKNVELLTVIVKTKQSEGTLKSCIPEQECFLKVFQEIQSNSCPYDRKENACTVSTSCCPIQSLTKVPCINPYKALENFSESLYGTTGGTYRACVFRPVMNPLHFYNVSFFTLILYFLLLPNCMPANSQAFGASLALMGQKL